MRLQGASVLVTGGTGTFGHAFVARCLAAGARRIVVFSRDELKQAEMQRRFPDPRMRWMPGDVRDVARLEDAFRGVEIVVHAAAMKRIDSCEAAPYEAIQTNVLGTVNVARQAVRSGVKRAVLLSTDKVPAPTTLYGSSKLLAERAWVKWNIYAAGTATRFSATRYGNVMASRGSVIPLWRRQYEAGEPLTITDESCTRFWMRITEAVDLVELALLHMRGGEVFIPKIGASTLLDMARAIVEVRGVYLPGHVVTGLRAGERRHETLISSDEARDTFDHGTHFTIEPDRTWEHLPGLDVPRVPLGFTYRSDTARQLTIPELRRMLDDTVALADMRAA